MQPLYATAYGNGVKLPKIPRTAAHATQALSYLIKLSRQQNNKARRAYPNFRTHSKTLF
jgi:hypothetical protein